MIYGIYFAYHKYEILPKELASDPTMPNYPRNLARVGAFADKMSQCDAFANTMCPASVCFEAETKTDFSRQVREFNENFENEEWLEVNIYPFI